jgi:hypothetical protein
MEPRVPSILKAAAAGFAGDFRGWFRPAVLFADSDAMPRVTGRQAAACAGFAGDFRGWLRPAPIEIWSSKTQRSFWPALRAGAHRKNIERSDGKSIERSDRKGIERPGVSARSFGD